MTALLNGPYESQVFIPQHAGRWQLMHSRCSPIPAFCSICTCPHLSYERSVTTDDYSGETSWVPIDSSPGRQVQLFNHYPHPHVHVPIITAYLLTFIPQLSYPSFTIFRTRRWPVGTRLRYEGEGFLFWIYLNRRLLVSFGNDWGRLLGWCFETNTRSY